MNSPRLTGAPLPTATKDRVFFTKQECENRIGIETPENIALHFGKIYNPRTKNWILKSHYIAKRIIDDCLIHDVGSAIRTKTPNKFNTYENVKNWTDMVNNGNIINPKSNKQLGSVFCKTYMDIYTIAFKILRKKHNDKYILDNKLLPEFLLFNNTLNLHYAYFNSINKYKGVIEDESYHLHLDMCDVFIKSNITGFTITTLHNIMNSSPTDYPYIVNSENIIEKKLIKSLILNKNTIQIYGIESLINILLKNPNLITKDHYSDNGIYKDLVNKDYCIDKLIEILKSTPGTEKIYENIKNIRKINEFYENYYLSPDINNNPSIKVNEYILTESRLSDTLNGKCLSDLIKNIKLWQNFTTDLHMLWSNGENIINNPNNISFEIKEDPVDKYFEKYETKLQQLRVPKFSKLIDLDTFIPIKETSFLNDAQYNNFIEEKNIKQDTYNKNKKEYEKAYDIYEVKKSKGTLKESDIEPLPPQRPIIKLPNNSNYILGTREPTHISDDLYNEFKEIYHENRTSINEFNKIKNLGYLDLVKSETNKSPTREIINYARDNILFSMTREQISDNILLDEYDESPDGTKCSEDIDILTNDEFGNINYPFAKLQLIVRLNFSNPDKTECLYAPKIYNYLVNCLNNHKSFVNPLNKIKYTEEHITNIMDVMRIVDPNIERPYYLKPVNDTKLYIDYENIKTNGKDFFNISIYRKFGNLIFTIYELCSIPAFIESTGDWGTNSNDLTSTVMLFKIYKLFNEGKLLSNYMPPYHNIRSDGRLSIINLGIHFNNFKKPGKWLYKLNNTKEKYINKTNKELIDMFKHYAEEVNNYS